MSEPKRGAETVYKSKKNIVLDNFLGGIAWGLGTAIGASTIVALLAYIVSKINFIPGISSLVAQILDAINQYGQNSPFGR